MTVFTFPIRYDDEPQRVSTTAVISDPVNATRVMCGALSLPTIATVVGRLFFTSVPDNLTQTLLVRSTELLSHTNVDDLPLKTSFRTKALFWLIEDPALHAHILFYVEGVKMHSEVFRGVRDASSKKNEKGERFTAFLDSNNKILAWNDLMITWYKKKRTLIQWYEVSRPLAAENEVEESLNRKMQKKSNRRGKRSQITSRCALSFM